jgi:hypothetical protein
MKRSTNGKVGQKKCVGDDRQRTPPSKNPPPISGMQAYIAYLPGRLISEGLVLLCSENDPRNVCRNAWETVVL